MTNDANCRHFDPRPLRESVADDAEVLDQLVELFVETSAAHMAQIEAAAAAGDTSTLRERAHALKGSLGVFRAQAALELCVAVERAAKATPPTIARDEITRLSAALAALVAEMRVVFPPPAG
jgi:HPt (histidine-containing phosphotransfer) domain-containing protein